MISEFLYNTYILPIKYEVGHNIINIATYAVLFLGFIYGVYRLLKKMNVKIDFKLYVSIIPFMIAGSLLRAMVDNHLYLRNFFTVTPGVYLVFSFAFVGILLLGIMIERKWSFEYWKTCTISGTAIVLGLILPKITMLGFENWFAVILCIILTLVLCFLIWVAIRKFKIEIISSKISQAAIYSQIFDGVNTSVLMDFIGGVEKHAIPRFLIEVTKTPYSFLVTKVLLALGVVYSVNKYVEEKDLRNALLMAVSIVGFAPGLRNLISYFIASVAPQIFLF